MIRPRKLTGGRRTLLLGALLLLVSLASSSCQLSTSGPGPPTPAEKWESASPITATVAEPSTPAVAETASSAGAVTSPSSSPFVGLTFHRRDGNRLAQGRGGMPKVSAVDIALGGQPLWLVAAPYRNGSLWVAVLADGRIEAFVVSGGAAAPIALSPSTVPAGMPPILLVEGDEARLLANPTEDASALTHPAFLPSQSGALAYLEQSGDLILWKGTELARLEAAGLPDARILIDDASRLLLLTGPSGRYQHGVLGDALEASGVALLDTSPSLSMVTQIEMAEPDVVEGISPIWSDLDGDGTREIIVTTSNESVGARIVVFNEAAEQMAAGPPIGRGFRWRHQIAVAPFGPSGELELAAVLTPHIGGQVEYYRLSGSELHIVAMLPGFSSHALGSRNLDAALGGDFDGDGQVELVVPDRAQQTLNGVRRSGDGAEVSWTVPIGGRISTNLTAVTDDDGRLALGAGHDGNGLRIWSP